LCHVFYVTQEERAPLIRVGIAGVSGVRGAVADAQVAQFADGELAHPLGELRGGCAWRDLLDARAHVEDRLHDNLFWLLSATQAISSVVFRPPLPTALLALRGALSCAAA